MHNALNKLAGFAPAILFICTLHHHFASLLHDHSYHGYSMMPTIMYWFRNTHLIWQVSNVVPTTNSASRFLGHPNSKSGLV